MFLVFITSTYEDADIFYIQNDDRDTIEKLIYKNVHYANDEIFLYKDSIYFHSAIKEYFEDNNICLNKNNKFDWKLFEKSIKNGDLDFDQYKDDIQELGCIQIINNNNLHVDFVENEIY